MNDSFWYALKKYFTTTYFLKLEKFLLILLFLCITSISDFINFSSVFSLISLKDKLIG